jgi:hypothetical protein
MQEMYSMSIVTHNYSVIALLLAVGINYYKLMSAKSVQPYRKFIMLFNAVGSTFLAVVIFTGVVMMAAKHLSFTIENIVMIVFSVVFIILEGKRAKKFKYIKNADWDGFLSYREWAKKIFAAQFILTAVIYVWMVSIAL